MLSKDPKPWCQTSDRKVEDIFDVAGRSGCRLLCLFCFKLVLFKLFFLEISLLLDIRQAFNWFGEWLVAVENQLLTQWAHLNGGEVLAEVVALFVEARVVLHAVDWLGLKSLDQLGEFILPSLWSFQFLFLFFDPFSVVLVVRVQAFDGEWVFRVSLKYSTSNFRPSQRKIFKTHSASQWTLQWLCDWCPRSSRYSYTLSLWCFLDPYLVVHKTIYFFRLKRAEFLLDKVWFATYIRRLLALDRIWRHCNLLRPCHFWLFISWDPAYLKNWFFKLWLDMLWHRAVHSLTKFTFIHRVGSSSMEFDAVQETSIESVISSTLVAKLILGGVHWLVLEILRLRFLQNHRFRGAHLVLSLPLGILSILKVVVARGVKSLLYFILQRTIRVLSDLV